MELKILIIEPTLEIAGILQKNFAEQFGAGVTVFSKVGEALTHFDLNKPKYSLIIVRNFSPKEEIAHIFLNYMYDQSLMTPLIVIGEFEHSYNKFTAISEILRVEELNRLAMKAMGLKKEDFKKLKLPEFIGYPLRFFYLLSLFPTHVYIKLVRKAGDEYVERFQKGENFSADDLEKFAELGLTELYIAKEENEIFMNAILIKGISSIKKTSTLEESVIATEQTFVISSELLKALGINPSTTLLVDQTLQVMRAQVNKPDQLSMLLKKLLDNQMSFSYRRSYLICLLSNELFPKMEWGSGEQRQNMLEKLSMISYFHDIYLDDDKLLKIITSEEFNKSDLTSFENDQVLNHANRAALLVQQYPRLPQGVDLILKQHHGTTNGVGFPVQLSASISPMAIFFLVLEDFATKILTLKPGEKINSIIPMFKERYQLPSYRKIVNEIEKMLKK